MTTITAFSNALADLTITGVTRKSRSKPASIQASEMPFQYVEYPEASSEPLSSCRDRDTYTLDLVILLNPTNQDRPETNHSNMLTMVDYMKTAIKTLHNSLNMIIRFDIVGGGRPLGEMYYYALTATVTGEDL